MSIADIVVKGLSLAFIVGTLWVRRAPMPPHER